VSTEEEEAGLDLSQHGERGYIMGIELSGGRPYGGIAPGYGVSITVEEPAAPQVLS
jgi:hypothetical protein